MSVNEIVLKERDTLRRLTKQDEQGNWCVKGLPWKDTYAGEIITENTNQKIYGALCKLKDYEESGLDPEEACRLKERDTAKKPIEHITKFAPMYECPSCGDIDVYGQKNCDNCGQRLDWSE